MALVVVDEASSTQDEVWALLRGGAGAPLWLMARRQTAGRGRMGRRWQAEEGNLAASVGLRMAAGAELAQLSFVAALALHKGLRKVMGDAGEDELLLKWPNDLLLGGRKVGGILLESETSPGAGEALVVIGFGVNLARAPRGEVRWPAAALAERGPRVGPDELMGALMESFGRWLETWRERGFGPLRAAWEKRAWGMGARMALDSGGEVAEGIFRGLDDDGAMRLEIAPGRVMSFHAGEVRHVREARGRGEG